MTSTNDNTFGIPLDIALRVIDAVASERATLKACCLVNRALLAHAQSLLFRSVKLEAYRVSKPYSQVIDSSTERGRALGQLTRELTFICNSDTYEAHVQLAPRDLVKILPHLPKLEHLELHLRGNDFTPDRHGVLSRATSITSLHLHNFNKFGQTNVHDILASLPQITKLRLSGSAFRIVPGREPLRLVLSDLHWDIYLEPSAQELIWLLGESSDLRTLSIMSSCEVVSGPLPGRLLPLVLERYGRNLHTLRLSNRVDSLDFVQSSCPSLSELSLRFWPTPPVLETLPRGLTHLALAGPDKLKTTANESALRELMSSIEGLPHLRIITWLTWDVVSPNERTEFGQFCEARGIKIVEPPPRKHDSVRRRPAYHGPPEALMLQSLRAYRHR
ncbi:unnamed protein product [Rhizoctonia solani]|uniref:F-box domain-containing protein n=1 Tax=Rhizoctonia solani TaxID=456999 RepID=A0A8H3H3E0_9AGAM|nr:unnamed protein product [Rhizoctonia solani]CAE7174515.1 unnamed protein product [Rhizoctonia solani]